MGREDHLREMQVQLLQVQLWSGGCGPRHCSLEFLPGSMSALSSVGWVTSPLEPAQSCTSPPDRLLWPLRALSSSPVSGLMSPGESPQPFRIRQNKESGSCGFSLANSMQGVFEGWGSRAVMWDTRDHGSLQEDCKEGCKGFRTA